MAKGFRDEHHPGRNPMNHLVTAIMRQGNVSPYEAMAAIEGHRRGDQYTSEAVGHYGGATKLIQDAIARRGLR